MSWTERLGDLGITLPDVAAPVASYVPAVTTGDLVHTSGQLPFVNGHLTVAGHVGDDVDPDTATGLARTAALNALAAIDSVVGLDSIEQIVKVVGFVASAPGFHGQPAVLNGASELFGEIFGEVGQHARSAVGVSDLPLNAPVEIEVIARFRAET